MKSVLAIALTACLLAGCKGPTDCVGTVTKIETTILEDSRNDLDEYQLLSVTKDDGEEVLLCYDDDDDDDDDAEVGKRYIFSIQSHPDVKGYPNAHRIVETSAYEPGKKPFQLPDKPEVEPEIVLDEADPRPGDSTRRWEVDQANFIVESEQKLMDQRKEMDRLEQRLSELEEQ